MGVGASGRRERLVVRLGGFWAGVAAYGMFVSAVMPWIISRLYAHYTLAVGGFWHGCGL